MIEQIVSWTDYSARESEQGSIPELISICHELTGGIVSKGMPLGKSCFGCNFNDLTALVSQCLRFYINFGGRENG